jgi:formylglycine-generating enzyme required for sulfatase activity
MEREMKNIICFMAAVLLLIGTSQAAIVIETLPVGNAGNIADTRYFNPAPGAVSYTYNIGKYEVTAGQYATFLNAVAATDTYGLYDTGMWSNTYGCKIQRSGLSGNYTYSIAAEWANRPVNYVSWGDVARFANWLHHGQPTGMQGPNTTEDGAYALNGATSNAALLTVMRKAGWRWAIASGDEWHKAAYHKNDGVTANYWDYPTGTNNAPDNQLLNPDPGNNATYQSNSGYTIGSPYYRTEVGAHEYSESPYGTFDQGGNIWEWIEAIPSGDSRSMRGGSAFGAGPYSGSSLFAGSILFRTPAFADGGIGFRVSEAVCPSMDLTGDCKVNLSDFSLLANQWLTTYDSSDLASMALEWLD